MLTKTFWALLLHEINKFKLNDDVDLLILLYLCLLKS